MRPLHHALLLGTLAACSAAATANPIDPAPQVDGGDVPDGEPGADSGAEAAPPEDAAVLPTGPDDISVMVEPSDKAQALLNAITSAKTSIHVTIYLMNDKRFIAALIAQKGAGREVKVILNQTFFDGAGANDATYSQLQGAGVAVAWAPSTFTLTHEKTVIIDGTQAWIMTMNLQTTSSSNREFLAIDNKAADVAEAEAIFAADFTGTPITPVGDLVVSPTNSRTKLLALIQSAKTSLEVEGETLSDPKVTAALITAKNAGVTVHVVLSDSSPSDGQTTAVGQLTGAGIAVKKVTNPYIHAKAIVADGTRAYMGSENFTTASLVYNRELGVITSHAPSVAAIGGAIAQDFAAGVAY